MDKNKKTTRSQGEHLKKKEVKIEIIKYILSEDDKVSGPDIKKYLLRKYNIVDEKNIRKHLRELQDQHCIEKIPGKPGLENKWEIGKIENLRNIHKNYPEENYPDMQLNKYAKSLDIVYEDQLSKGYFFGDYYIYPNKLRVELFISKSFFKVCLDKDIKTLCDNAYEYYKYGEGFEKCKHIQNCIDKFYNKCIKPISINPKIWLDVYEKDTSNFSESRIYHNIPKNLPNAEISEETFREILEDSDIWRFDSNDWESRFVGEFSIKLTEMVCQKVLNKIPTESMKIWKKELKEKSIYVLEELIKEIPAVEAPTANPVLTERFEEIYSLRVLVGKEESKEITALREVVEDVVQRTKVAPTTNLAPTTNPDSTEFDSLVLAIEQFIKKQEPSKPSFIYLRELSTKITYEIFQQMFKHIPIELPDTPEIPQKLIEIFKKILQEVLQEIQVLPDEMYELLTEITIHRLEIVLSIHDRTFKHCFDTDIEDGNFSSNERDYIVMMKELDDDLVKGTLDSLDVKIALDHFLELNLKEAENVLSHIS